MKDDYFDEDLPSRFPNSKQDYRLITPAMKAVADIVMDEVQHASSGNAFYGEPRCGKSQAMKYALEQVREKHPTVTCLRATMVTRSRTSDTRFYKALADEFSLGIPNDGDGDDLRSAIVKQLLVICSETHDPRVLILLDEAHRIRPIEFSFLIDLTNRLESTGIAPIVILNGQPELMEEREKLDKAKRKDVIGRFMEHPFPFVGVSNHKDLNEIMNQFDDASFVQFPAGSGQCITAAYTPHLYKKGFRFGSCAATFWESIETSANQLNIVHKAIGMNSLTKALEMALTLLASAEESDSAYRKAWWTSVLQESGYLKNLVTMSKRT